MLRTVFVYLYKKFFLSTAILCYSFKLLFYYFLYTNCSKFINEFVSIIILTKHGRVARSILLYNNMRTIKRFHFIYNEQIIYYFNLITFHKKNF
jgi:hypothetical protein